MVLIALVLGIEAFARGYFAAYLLRVLAVIVLLNLLWEFAANWQVVTYWVLISARSSCCSSTCATCSGADVLLEMALPLLRDRTLSPSGRGSR